MLETRTHSRVFACTSGAEALEVLAAWSYRIDLLITDLVMPGMDGNELIREAKKINPELKCLLVSDEVKQYESGINADCFLPNGSCFPAEILFRVDIMLKRKRGPKARPPQSITAPPEQEKGLVMA